MELRVIRGHADHVKPHQLGSALNEWRIVLGKARGMRLALNIDAEDHENRYVFGHAGDLRCERLRAPRPASAQRGTVNITGT